MTDRLEIKSNRDAQTLIDSYPAAARKTLKCLRKLIIDTARETENVRTLTESLKWGEPTYTANHGSPLRIDWKPAEPDQVGVYFHCRTTLVDTFRELYRDKFVFSGNRAILLPLDSVLPETALKHCISLALTYHKRKHLWMLGA